MTKEEIIIASHKEFKHQLEIGSKAPLSIQEGFVKGAEWMQEKMLDNPTGGASLYAVENTAERTKREVINKAVEWLSNNMFHSVNNGIQINGIHIQDFLGKFKQAMEE